MTMIRRLVVLILVVAVAYTGWNYFGPGPSRPNASVADASEFRCWPPYPVGPAPPIRYGTGRVPKDFVPVAAITCDPYFGDVAADSTAEYVERKWEGDFGPALRLLNDRSEPESWPLKVCTVAYSAAMIDDMWLLDQHGRAVRPGYPVDDCGMSKIGGLAEIKKLETVSTVAHRVQLDPSLIEQVSGCTSLFEPPAESSATLDSDFAAYGFCRFSLEPSGPRFDGSFGADIDVEGLPIAPDCLVPATKVAVGSTYLDDTRTVLIEFDGCRRVIVDGYAALGASEEILQSFPSDLQPPLE